ncbi:hypothetical protein HMPREF3048_00410 [Corynebacterium sp. HMSC075D04]|uniref:hypothetical protein n=1 Tax=Corynebacterium TaxID=1716 RepID=UPI0008A468AF|nr:MULTISPECIES: hypothetical protein [Corynebacterium]MDK8799474.1 hypothetical protein [Corynebacterium coyleae]MDK8823405.1 hypothetical protein [Corynebacterium coyleae]OFO37064.1 hypothetical protein HMPREF3048_00410 [Corynebacterium sp. HMSC075D04]OHO35248.1 hypothetical protein HMPREF2690_02220 [Corynebacterium sp. HMSC034E11]OHQ56988.1 hypothetical protein HMPREF2617_01150 [Corynebacterium sp. HMSC070H05]
MKRTAAAVLAATTALSLAAVPAHAVEIAGKETGGYGHAASSQVTEAELGVYALAAIAAEFDKPGEGFSAPFMGSSKAGMFETKTDKEIANQNAVMTSSYQNDANNGYKLGTTYDILVGTGIAALVLAALGGAAYAGVIPGVQLPF